MQIIQNFFPKKVALVAIFTGLVQLQMLRLNNLVKIFTVFDHYIIMEENLKQIQLPLEPHIYINKRPLDSRRRTTTTTRFNLKFFRYFSKHLYPESFIVLHCTTRFNLKFFRYFSKHLCPESFIVLIFYQKC